MKLRETCRNNFLAVSSKSDWMGLSYVSWIVFKGIECYMLNVNRETDRQRDRETKRERQRERERERENR